MPANDDPLHGLAVFERGWLSSNNVLIHAADGDAGACLIDSSHVKHAAQTEALLRQALAGRPLTSIVNTHLHSDHCGGNASLQRAFGASVHIPPGQAADVQAWDDDALSYRATGQCMEPFRHQAVLSPDQPWRAGGRQWELIAAPGHDPHMVMLFDRAHGLLVSADALWENGFGLVFPEMAGEPGFDDLGATLELIARLPVRLVIPGHGRPFADVPAALARARRRLQGFRSAPARHAWHGLKVLLKYHLMEQGRQAGPALRAWALATPLLQSLWQRHAPSGVADAAAWVDLAVAELVDKQVLAREGDVVVDV